MTSGGRVAGLLVSLVVARAFASSPRGVLRMTGASEFAHASAENCFVTVQPIFPIWFLKGGEMPISCSCMGIESSCERAIPRGTRQALGLREVAGRIGVARATVKRWWKEGRFVGRTSDDPQPRVVVPVEVVDFYLRHFRLPTKLELFEAGALSCEFLLELGGPDGGLCELGTNAPREQTMASRRVVTQ